MIDPSLDAKPSFPATVVGALMGGLAACAFVIAVTTAIKELLAQVMRRSDLVLLVAPFVGIVGAVLILNRLAHGQAVQTVTAEGEVPKRFGDWLRFPASAVRADLTADLVRTSGRDETFPWKLAPVRALAIISTVGMGAPMGTESPAAHLGAAAGAALGSVRESWRKLGRPAAVSGAAAGIAVLMGLPLVGLAFVLELGRRNESRIGVHRVVAAAVGAVIGWACNQAFGLSFIRLIVPEIAPHDLPQALATVCLVGAVTGALSSLTGSLIYRARGWVADPKVKLAAGAALLLVCILALRQIAAPAAAIGPGAAAVSWAELAKTSGWTLLAIAGIRAVATVAAVTAGGCGGLFVPLLAIGDLCGRALAPGLGASADLAASAGSAGAISGGYRLPVTAAAMVLTIGGPGSARITCVATVVVAAGAGVAVAYGLDRFSLRGKQPAIV